MNYKVFEYIMIIRIAKFSFDINHEVNIDKYYEEYKEYNSKKLEVLKKEVQSIYETLETYETKFCTILDDEYPIEFSQLKTPPLIFFYKGNISLLKAMEKTGFIGSRNVSEMQIKKVTEVSHLLDMRNNIVVSGLAKGVDYSSQIDIVQNKNNCIAILPTSFDNVSPKSSLDLYENILSNNGLVISEYYPTQIGRIYNSYYLARNRLIMALSSKVIIGSISVDTSKRGHKAGGTGTALEFALEMKKPIYFIKDNSYNENVYNYLDEIGAIGFGN